MAMEEGVFFNDYSSLVLAGVIMGVFGMMLSVMKNSHVVSNNESGDMLEMVWTVMPSVVLYMIGIPSLMLLYTLEENTFPQLTMKSVGHQWYWSYEMCDVWSGGEHIQFDSYMKGDSLVSKEFRLLDVDNRMSLPFNIMVRNLVTSVDVLHSWTIPSLGIKTDCSPGRMNHLTFLSYRPGVYFGQCSEICGANHSFMPIVLEFISPKFWYWHTLK